MPKRHRYAIVVLCLVIGLVLTDLLLDVFGGHLSPGFFRLKQAVKLGAATAGTLLIFLIVTNYLRKPMLLIDDEILEMYFRDARVAAVFLKPDLRIYYANPMLCRIIGLEMEDLVGEIWLDLFSDDTRDAARRFLEGFVRGDSRGDDPFEGSLVGKDRKLYTLSWRNTAVRDTKGKLLGILSLGQDITQRKEQQECLEYLSAAFAASSEAMVVANLAGKITHINEAGVRLGRFRDAGEVIGKDVLQLLAPEDRDRARADMQYLMEHGTTIDYRYKIVIKDGQKIPVEVSSAVMRDEEGNILGLVGVVKDVSERLAIEERLRIAAELGSDIVYTWEVASDELTWYGDIAGLLGYAPGDIPRTIEGWLALIHPEDRRWLEEAVEFHRTSCHPIRYEYRVKHKDGHWLHWLSKGQPVLGETGKITRWIGVCIDVTAERKAQEALRRSEERYRLLSENIPVVVYSSGSNPFASCLFVSGKVKDLTGYSPHEFLEDAELWKSIMHPGDRERVEANIKRSLANKTSINEEYRIVTKSGKTKWVRYRANPILNSKGEITRIDGFIEDISERKRAELGLQRSERELRICHEIASTFVTTHGEEVWSETLKIITSALRAGYGCLGVFIGNDEITFHSLSLSDGASASSGEKVDRHSLEDTWKQALAVRRTLTAEGEIPTYDDKHKLRNVAITPLMLESQLVGILGIGDCPSQLAPEDVQMLERITRNIAPIIHERLRSEAKERERARIEKEKQVVQLQLQQAQKMEALGALAGGIAHEFNNLLATIRGYAELVLTKVNKGSKMACDLRQIKKASDRAADLTRQLLLFGRSHPMETTLVDINAIVNGMTTMLSRLIGESITIETKLDPQAWRVKGDRRNIEQVIMNLVLNAKEAMPDGGKITIATHNSRLKAHIKQDSPEEQEFVCITVDDTGVGMDKETLKHIFEPFFTTKRSKHGGGLGLAVVHGIVEQHGGRIEVESRKDVGTTFRVYLPAVLEAPLSEPKPPASADLKGKGSRILVVEDEESVMTLFVRILSENGYEVTKAQTCNEARKFLEEYTFDLVLTDVVLPDGSGVELANEVKARNDKVAIVLTSGYTDGETSWRELAEDGFGFIAKPFSVVELLRTIGRALAARKVITQEEENQIREASVSK